MRADIHTGRISQFQRFVLENKVNNFQRVVKNYKKPQITDSTNELGPYGTASWFGILKRFGLIEIDNKNDKNPYFEKSILSIGCGDAKLESKILEIVLAMKNCPISLHLVDINEDSIRRAIERVKSLLQSKNSFNEAPIEITFTHANPKALDSAINYYDLNQMAVEGLKRTKIEINNERKIDDFENKKKQFLFDYAFSSHMLGMVHDLDIVRKIMSDVNSVLKPGGQSVFTIADYANSNKQFALYPHEIITENQNLKDGDSVELKLYDKKGDFKGIAKDYFYEMKTYESCLPKNLQRSVCSDTEDGIRFLYTQKNPFAKLSLISTKQ